MLQAIRDRAQGIFAWVLLILIGVPFALWGIQNYLDTGRESPVAEVGDREIFERDVNRVYEESLGNLIGLAQFDETQIKRQALERLIRDELIAQAADAQGLVVSDEEARSFVQSLPYFQTDGGFDRAKYESAMASQNLSSAQFIAQVRRAIATEQWQRAIRDSAFATPRQIGAVLRLQNQEREIDYVTIPIGNLDQPISGEEIAAYYGDHRQDFRTEQSVDIDYLLLSLDDLAKEVRPNEEDLRALYAERLANFTTAEQRRVSHILIAAEAGDPEADKAALSKVKEIRERVMKGEDFAKLAKELSQDTVSAPKGGDLGLVGKGAMEPNFEQAALALDKGSVSEPVRTPFGYHLIKVTELTPAVSKSFEEVKSELIGMAQENAADSQFYELGQKLTELGFEHPDTLDPAAKAIGRPILRITRLTRDQGEGLGSEQAIRDAAFSEDVLKGRNSDLIELSDNRVAILRVREHQKSKDKPLEEVRDEIVRVLRMKHSIAQAKQAASELVKKLQAGEALEKVAKAVKLVVKSPAPFHRNATDLPPDLVRAVFSSPAPKPQGTTVGSTSLASNEQVVFVLKAVRDAVDNGQAKHTAEAAQLLERTAGQATLSTVIAQLRDTGSVTIRPEKD